MRTPLAEGSSEGLFNSNHKEDSKFVSSSIGSEISYGSWTSDGLGSQSLSWEDVGSFSKQQLKRRLSHISDDIKEGKNSKNDEDDEKDGLTESTETQVSHQVNLLLEEDEKRKPSFNNFITEECIFELELDMDDKVTRPSQSLDQEEEEENDNEHRLSSNKLATSHHSTSSASSAFLRSRPFAHEKQDEDDDDEDGYPNISSRVQRLNTPQLLSFSQPTYQYPLSSSWGNNTNGNIQSSPSKKSLCKFFSQGTCKAGSECRYSHDIAVSPQQPPLSPPLGAQAAFSPMTSNSILGSSPNLLPLNTGSLNRERRNSSTKFCKFYAQGYCRYAETCPFLHQDHDMFESPPVYATPHSPHVQSSPLFAGDFDHQQMPNLSLQQSPPSPPLNSLSSSFGNGDQKQVCTFFSKGECKFGEKCRNLHQVPMKKKLITEESIRKFSTIPCKYFVTQNFCPWGTACYYNHNVSPSQPQATTFLSHMASRRQNM